MSGPDRLVVGQYNVGNVTTEEVQHPGTDHVAAVAEVVQSAPDLDVLLCNELANNFQQGWTRRHNATALLEDYLRVPQRPALDPVDFEHVYAPATNSGVPSGMDVFKDGLDCEPGTRAYGNDCFGYGEYPGRYAMALLADVPIDVEAARTFRRFRWSAMPDDKMPTDDRYEVFLTDAERDRFRLSSKTHADVPLRVGDRTLRALIAHPTPPVHDGPENLNGRRCHDEIRLLGDYVSGADYPVDDDGVAGGLDPDDPFVVMGDMNAAPGEAYRGDVGGRKPEEFHFDAARRHLLENPRIDATAAPTSPGGRARGDERATQFGDGWARRADYVLPSNRGLEVVDAGAVWPGPNSDRGALREAVLRASDHVLLWIELEFV